MANKNVQLKDLEGNLLFPKTKAAVVFNDNNESLGTVEAGAQVNKIETVKLNGTALTITDKAVNVELPAAVAYSVVKAESADEGYSATYQLAADGVAFGTKINVPKDMVVSGGEVKKATAANNPVTGLAKGDPYIELTIANNDGTKLYIPVKDLVDVYTADEVYIKEENNKFSLDIAQVKTAIQDTFYTETEIDSMLSNKQGNLTEAQLLAVNSGITADKVSTYDGYASTIEGKAAKATTLAGYNIGDAYTKTEAETMVDGKIAGLITYEVLA